MAQVDAAFSACGHYRWWLQRRWAAERPVLLFVGLNPSRADGRHNDPTLRRLIGFASTWGYGGLEVLNLFARISASPAVLRRAADPVGPHTDAWIRRRLRAQPQAPLWLGWGNHGPWRGRDRAVLALLAGRRLLCLGCTASGQPRHPLYLPATAPLRPWHSAWHPEDPCAEPSPCRVPPAATPCICT